jgi:hypothetical protein
VNKTENITYQILEDLIKVIPLLTRALVVSLATDSQFEAELALNAGISFQTITALLVFAKHRHTDNRLTNDIPLFHIGATPSAYINPRSVKISSTSASTSSISAKVDENRPMLVSMSASALEQAS